MNQKCLSVPSRSYSNVQNHLLRGALSRARRSELLKVHHVWSVNTRPTTSTSEPRELHLIADCVSDASFDEPSRYDERIHRACAAR
ncbi:hypothetical protein VTO73DRAFT_9403 [Trametes versicolor]